MGLVMILRPIALTQMVEIPLTDFSVRPFGDPEEALTRIERENFTTSAVLDELARDQHLSPLNRLVYQYAPLVLTPSGEFPTSDDTFIGVYYLASQTTGAEITVTTIQYFYFSTDESGGTHIRKRLALFGQPIDRELIYRVTIVDGRVSTAYFQAPGHRLVRYEFEENTRPIFTVASANHNFRPVRSEELEQRSEYRVLAPVPRHELLADPAHDPDFIALAAQEAVRQHGVDLSQYIYIEFQNPVHDGVATISIRVQGRWYYLHDSISGLTRPGYNQIGINLGYAPQPEMIEDLWLVAYSRDPIELEVISVYIYPRIKIAA